MKICIWIIGWMGLCLSSLVYGQELPAYLDENRTLDERVEDALGRLTTAEKVALCHAQSKFSSRGVARLGIPELWMSDGPHGVRAEISWDSWSQAGWGNDCCTAFPALTALAATFNPEMAAIYGKAIGEEARYRNKSVLLGPGVNICRTPLNGRNFEYMGEDPLLAARMAVPYIRGVQQNGVAACVKHFALNNQEKWRDNIDVEVSERALREIYLPAFRAAVEEGGAWSVMGAYNCYRGEQCCHNHWLLNHILKGEWKFDGAVISDWGGVHNTEQAISNGLDIEMGTGTNGLNTNIKDAYERYYLARPYLDALERGEADMKTLDSKVRRVLRLIFRTVMNTRRPWGSLETEEHAVVARRVAEEGIVLLKNDPLSGKEPALLPLTPGKVKKIAVIGENAVWQMTKGGGSSELKVRNEISPLQGLQDFYKGKTVIVYSMGYTSGKTADGGDSLLRAAVKVAGECDAVIYIGGLNKKTGQDSEGADRQGYGLSYGQDRLIGELVKANRKTVVVLVSGNAVAMPWVKDVPSIVQAWYCGSEAGRAVAAVLGGKVNPSGKLPFSFPVKLADCSAHAYDSLCYPGDGKKVVYKEDLLVGYRWHDTRKIPALFPFGHGLSYTTFDFGKPVIDRRTYGVNDTIRVSCEIRNTGKTEGAEVMQVYVGDPICSLPRPLKELKGFSKVNLKPGEEREVTVAVPVRSLAFYDDRMRVWTVEPGTFVVYVGNSSAGDLQTEKIQIKF